MEFESIPNSVLASAVNFCRQWKNRGILTMDENYNLYVKFNGQKVSSPALSELNMWTSNISGIISFLTTYSQIAYSANITNRAAAHDDFSDF